MQKIIALILALSIILASCSNGRNPAENEKPIEGNNSYHDRYCVLFWPDLEKRTLISVIEPIGVFSGEKTYEAVIKKLFETPPPDATDILNKNVRLISVSSVQNIVTVNLSSEFATNMYPSEQLIAIMSIVNTMTSFRGIDYVVIKVNGEDFKLGNRPFGPLSRYYTDISTAYYKFMADLALQYDTGPVNETFNCALYFASKDKKHVIPEVRTVNFKDKKYIETIINELSGGPLNDTYLMSTLEYPL
ncbi:MAG TPA: GerMN domain-containing protein, partial [Clostridia bacterium]|nr:GerMN domain-containing protein [Clostridia bacterium]